MVLQHLLDFAEDFAVLYALSHVPREGTRLGLPAYAVKPLLISTDVCTLLLFDLSSILTVTQVILPDFTLAYQ